MKFQDPVSLSTMEYHAIPFGQNASCKPSVDNSWHTLKFPSFFVSLFLSKCRHIFKKLLTVYLNIHKKKNITNVQAFSYLMIIVVK
jgi:hypothetical protein